MHAAAAMVNVTELDADEVPREQLDTHLPRFMHALEQLIGSSLPKARASTFHNHFIFSQKTSWRATPSQLISYT